MVVVVVVEAAAVVMVVVVAVVVVVVVAAAAAAAGTATSKQWFKVASVGFGPAAPWLSSCPACVRIVVVQVRTPGNAVDDIVRNRRDPVHAWRGGRGGGRRPTKPPKAS